MNIAFKTAWIGFCFFTGVSFLMPLYASAAAQTGNVCIQCHGSQTGRLGKPVELWRSSIHADNGIVCDNCHGGDPKDAANAMSPARGFLGVPKEMDIPGVCGRCHVGVLNDYLASPHGKALGRGGPTCVTCHGNHLVKKATIDLINEKNCTRCHDFERARRIRESMMQTESRLVAIDRRIEEFKERGVDTSQMEKKLFAARNRFHTLFHELDAARLKGETSAIDSELDKLLLSIKEIDETDRKKRLAGVVAIAGALLAALLLRLYMKTFE